MHERVKNQVFRVKHICGYAVGENLIFNRLGVFKKRYFVLEWLYIGYQRLRFTYDNRKAKFKPKSVATKKMKSWDEFIKPHRD